MYAERGEREMNVCYTVKRIIHIKYLYYRPIRLNQIKLYHLSTLPCPLPCRQAGPPAGLSVAAPAGRNNRNEKYNGSNDAKFNDIFFVQFFDKVLLSHTHRAIKGSGEK